MKKLWIALMIGTCVGTAAVAKPVKGGRLLRAPASAEEFAATAGEGGSGMSFMIGNPSAQKIFDFMKDAKKSNIGDAEVRCGELCCTHSGDQYFCQVDLKTNGSFRSISGD